MKTNKLKVIISHKNISRKSQRTNHKNIRFSWVLEFWQHYDTRPKLIPISRDVLISFCGFKSVVSLYILSNNCKTDFLIISCANVLILTHPLGLLVFWRSAFGLRAKLQWNQVSNTPQKSSNSFSIRMLYSDPSISSFI